MSIRTTAAAVALAFCLPSAAFAEAPFVVTTILPPASGRSSTSSGFTAIGDSIYLFSHENYTNQAIWKWTEAEGAQVVKRINTNYSSPASLMPLGDKLLISAHVDSRGRELWISDGTSFGTTLLKDIALDGSSAPALMTVAGGKAYFSAYDTDHGRELWSTDGTPEGTTLVADLTGDSSSSSPAAFAVAGGKIYFSAANQFWVSDGSEAGTIALASGVSGTPPGVLDDTVFFLGSDDEHGRELWSTDGTVAGTGMVKDINPGPASSWGGIPTDFVRSGDALLFFAEEQTNGRELWRTSGNAADTLLVSDITPGPESTSLSRLVSSLAGAFFIVDNAALWFSDGTGGGTAALHSLSGVRGMVGAADGAYLVTSDPALIFSDGTTAGTIEIAGVTPNGAPELTATGGMVLFNGKDESSGYQPWTTDGTEGGTRQLANVSIESPFAGPAWIKAAGSNGFFGVGSDLFRSDGTAAGTFPLGDLAWYSDSGYPADRMAVFGTDLLYFGRSGGTDGLMKSDGTVAGTSMVKAMRTIDQIFAGSANYSLLVGAETSSWGNGKLWRTDGTAAGTIRIGPDGATNFVDVAGRTYFLAWQTYYGPRHLWSTEGTAESTRLLVKGEFTALVSAGGSLYAVNEDDATGRELWRSDGTADGLAMVKDITPGPASSDPSSFAAAGSVLFFAANDGVHGREVWRSDGTESGTFILKDINVGAGSISVSSAVASGPYVYFEVQDGSYRDQLWRTDGTTAGTILLALASDSNSSMGWLTAVDGKVMLAGPDPWRGVELWESDGTVAGTFAAFDLVAGPASGNPRNLTVGSELLFFSTSDARLWAMPRAASYVTIADRRVNEGNSGLTALQFTVTRGGDLGDPASVSYTTEDITAEAGVDYQPAAGTIAFGPGEATKQIAVSILGDGVLEQNESFAVVLAGAIGTAIARARAVGIIEEDDRRVALSIQYVPKRSSYYQDRTFRISNAGPSGASVKLNVSESPFEGTFECDGQNPSFCDVGLVPAGQSVDFTVRRSSSRGLVGTSGTAGRTLTATVTAFEAEVDRSDNTLATMIDGSGTLALPSYLVTGSTATARVTSNNYYLPATVQLELSGGVIISPSSATVTNEDPIASFSLIIPSNAWGWSTVRVNAQAVARVPVVLPGEEPLLETAILAPEDYDDYRFDYGETVTLPIRVAATLPDGIRPSNSVELRRRDDDTLLQTQVLDAAGAATFTVDDLPIGPHQFKVVYSGDQHFNSVTVNLPTVNVVGWATYLAAVVDARPCGASEIVARVTNPGGHTPTGLVKFRIGSTVIEDVLEPTGTAGEARASVRYEFGSSWTSVSVTYVPDDSFVGSYGYAYYEGGACPAASVIASAVTPTSVSLLWSDVGADQYDVIRADATSAGVFTPVGSTTATNFVDGSAAPATAYLYKVVAKSAAGIVRSTSSADLATTVIFTNDPLALRSTTIQAAHVTQLQQAAHAIRALAALPPATLTPVSSGSPARASDISSLRAPIAEALGVLGQPVPSWLTGVGTGQVVKALHLQQIRNAVK